MLIEIKSDEEFENQILNSKQPCVIDFYTDWCPPCKAMVPKLEKISEEFENVNFFKVNAELATESAAMFNVMSVPMLVSFYKKSLKEISGLVMDDKIRELAQLALDESD